jgi:hypothetical protein
MSRSEMPGVGRPQHASPAPGLAQIRTVAANLARRAGMEDGWPDGVDDLLLRRCHELLAGIKVLEEHAVCRTTSPDEHKPWCPKHSDDSEGSRHGGE